VLEARCRALTTPQRDMKRARIVLLAAARRWHGRNGWYGLLNHFPADLNRRDFQGPVDEGVYALGVRPAIAERLLGSGAPVWTPGLHPSRRRRCRVARSNALVYPVLHFLRQPRDSASAQSYPLRELAGGFEPRDVLKAVRDSIDGFQFLLRYQLLCHRTLPSQREHRDARQKSASGQAKCSGYGATKEES
jgi:hypothetical protein